MDTMAALRVLLVLEPPDGGVAVHVRRLVGGLVERGHQVDAIVSRRGPFAEDLRGLGARAETADFVPEMLAPGHDARALRTVCSALRRRRWDVVHTHGNKAGVLARPGARIAGMPVVHTPHGFAYATQDRRPRPGARARRALTLGIERALAPFAQAIVCVSETERDSAVRDRVAAAGRFVVVPNGVPIGAPATPDPRLAGTTDDPPLIGFLGRLSQEKGPLVLVRALSLLRDRGHAFRAALVGDGPQREEVLEAIARERLGERVSRVAFPGRPEPALAAFDLYVLPSLWESLSIGVLEAMAASLPVVASDVGGTREAVRHGETGLLVAPSDPETLASAIERLLESPAERARMGAAGRRLCEERFSLGAMLDGTEAVYRRAMGGKRSQATG